MSTRLDEPSYLDLRLQHSSIECQDLLSLRTLRGKNNPENGSGWLAKLVK